MKIITQKFILPVSFYSLIMLLCTPLNEPEQNTDSVDLLIQVHEKANGFNHCVGDEVKFKVIVLLPHLVKNVSVHFDENGNRDNRQIKTNETNNEKIFFNYVYKKKGLKNVIFTITFRGSGEKRDKEYKIDIGVIPTIRNNKNLLVGSEMILGKPMVLTVEHEEFGKATYKWYKDSVLLPGPAMERQSIIFNPLKESDAGQYYCIVSTKWGEDRSKQFDLNFKKNIIAPIIKKHPEIIGHPGNKKIEEGKSVKFSVVASGTDLKYQWQKNGSNIENATNSEYKLTASSANDRAEFRCVVSNNSGEVKSNTAKLSVLYKITFNKNDGTESYRKYYVRDHEVDLPKPARDGHIFKGWSDGSSNYDTGYTMKAKSVTFTAIWEAKTYTVKFKNTNKNISMNKIPDKVIKYSNNRISLPDHSYDGTEWKFLGWCNSHIFDKDNVYEAGEEVTITKNMTFWAFWNERRYKKVSARAFQSLFLDIDGTLWASGKNGFGQLGTGDTTDRIVWEQVMGKVLDMSAGAFHSLFLRSDGTLWTCGHNRHGQLGNGTTIDQITPVQVMSGVQSIFAGGEHSMILKTDSTLWTCGHNSSGQLGDGTTTVRNTPVQVMSGIQSMAAGFDHSLILRTDGTLWTCGNNSFGQLGVGDSIDRSTPVQVMSGVQSISAGLMYSMILRSDGSLWVCGRNKFGQLGVGDTVDRSTPVKVGSGVKSMSAGTFHSLILRKDDILWACGSNTRGQLGDGTTENRIIPVQIMSGVKSMTAGGWHNLFIKKDGSSWVCGYNKYGQFGDGTTSNRLTPVQINF